MSVQYVDPQGTSTTPNVSYDLVLQRGRHTIALLSNGFMDATNFLHETAKALRALDHDLLFKSYVKPSVNRAPEALLRDIAVDCGAVLAAYGH